MYRLRVLTCVSPVALWGYASPRSCLRALPMGRGRRAYFYVLEASRSKALSLLLASGLAFRYGHFDGKIDRTNFFSEHHPTLWFTASHDQILLDRRHSVPRLLFVGVFSFLFQWLLRSSVVFHAHGEGAFMALSLINGGHRSYKYSRNVPRYFSVSPRSYVALCAARSNNILPLPIPCNDAQLLYHVAH